MFKLAVKEKDDILLAIHCVCSRSSREKEEAVIEENNLWLRTFHYVQSEPI